VRCKRCGRGAATSLLSLNQFPIREIAIQSRQERPGIQFPRGGRDRFAQCPHRFGRSAAHVGFVGQRILFGRNVDAFGSAERLHLANERHIEWIRPDVAHRGESRISGFAAANQALPMATTEEESRPPLSSASTVEFFGRGPPQLRETRRGDDS
jgi:hypothetical protein